jgi:hypothetical protein
MYSCLYDTCVDINLSLCFQDGFWLTSGSSFRGSLMKITSMMTCLWVDGNLLEALLILDTSEPGWIRWTMLMSSEGRTRVDETLRLFRMYVGTPDGLWTT